MSKQLLVAHDHMVYRVIRQRWGDPLDASYSRARHDNRWNTRAFPALYACCSEQVARAVALDVFRLAGVELEDLHPEIQPALVEITWSGMLVDIASSPGVAAAGFPATYPSGVNLADTQKAAAAWHAGGLEGVVCRSASLARLGFSGWKDPHQPWGEVAIFPQNAKRAPRRRRTRGDYDWLRLAPQPTSGDGPGSQPDESRG
jgi:RES domain-containing protein